jgi:hypothetical protein
LVFNFLCEPRRLLMFLSWPGYQLQRPDALRKQRHCSSKEVFPFCRAPEQMTVQAVFTAPKVNAPFVLSTLHSFSFFSIHFLPHFFISQFTSVLSLRLYLKTQWLWREEDISATYWSVLFLLPNLSPSNKAFVSSKREVTCRPHGMASCSLAPWVFITVVSDIVQAGRLLLESLLSRNPKLPLCLKFTRERNKQTYSVAWVRERTMPTERPQLIGEVNSNFFAVRGSSVVSTTDPYGFIFGFLDRSRYFFFKVAPQL